MKIDIDVIKMLLESWIPANRISNKTGIPRMTIGKYRNGQAALMNMTLKNALALQEYTNNEEEFKMLKQLKEDLEELRNEEWFTDETLLDWYFEPSTGLLYFIDSGMAYAGDDKEAYEVYQTEGMEVISVR